MFRIKPKNILIIICFVITLLFFLGLFLKQNGPKINDPELNTPEDFSSPGTDNYPNIDNLDKLINAGTPERAVLSLKRLFYDYQKVNTVYVIDIGSLKREFTEKQSDNPKYVTGGGVFKFNVRSENNNIYYCKIVRIDSYDFEFVIYSDENFTNKIYDYVSSDSELGD